VVTAYLGLGSNLGDRRMALKAAVAALDQHPSIEVDRASGIASLYETTPVGVPSPQPPYLNSVVRIGTTLSPEALLEAALSIEAALGRVRSDRFEPRTIDIDLLLYADLVMDTPSLTLPHPRLHERRFVFDPLAEIAVGVMHPVLKVSIAELARLREERPDDRVDRIAGPGWPNSS